MITEQELLQRAREIYTKIIARSGVDSEALSPKINTARLEIDGPYTFIFINGLFPGFAKFNPADKKVWTEMLKSGRTRFREQSKFSKDAGVNIALHRAVKKFVFFVSEQQT